MDRLFDSLLTEDINDDISTLINKYKLEWSSIPTADKLPRLRELIIHFPDNENLRKSFDLYKDQWEREQQDLANKHILLYKKGEEFVGYRFMGFATNSAMQKWILCGSDEFIESYKSIKDDETAKKFSDIFICQIGNIDKEAIRNIDTTHSSNRIKRIMEITKDGIKDSGWLPNP